MVGLHGVPAEVVDAQLHLQLRGGYRPHIIDHQLVVLTSRSNRLEPKASIFGIMGATRWLPRTPSVRTRDRGFGGKPPSGFPLIPAS